MDPRRLQCPREQLLHVFPGFHPGAVASMLADLPTLLPAYAHTLVHEVPPDTVDLPCHTYLQACGVDIIQVPRITAELLYDLNASAAMLYEVEARQHHDLGAAVPSIYYAYGDYDEHVSADVLACPSIHNIGHDGKGMCRGRPDIVMPPLLNTRALRDVAGQPGVPTVALITSGSRGKFPYALARALARALPKSAKMLVSIPNDYDWGGVLEVVTDTEERRFVRCPVVPQAPLTYMVHADVIVYGTAPGYFEPYGRTVMEAMALGKAVVCESKGVFQHALRHKVNALLYDTIDDAVELTLAVLASPRTREQLGANAQLRAGAEDASLHVTALKRALGMIGQ